MTDCIYQFLSDFQTLIAGLIGFTGVIITLLINAWLSRRQHYRAIEHETGTIRTALIAELELIEKSFQDKSVPSKDGEKPSDAFHPGSTPQPIFDNFIEKIGLLSSEEVSAVIEAYTMVNEAPSRIQLLFAGHDPSFNKQGYIFIRAKHEKTASGIYENFLPAIREALAALKRHHDH